MTASLSIAIDQPTPRTPVQHGMFVQVRQVADGNGNYPDQPFETALMVRGGLETRIKVPDGRYRVDMRLPSGAVMRESRSLQSGQTKSVRFELEQSAHEWLDWQTVTGNVPSGRVYAELRRSYDEGLDPVNKSALPSRLPGQVIALPEPGRELWTAPGSGGTGIEISHTNLSVELPGDIFWSNGRHLNFAPFRSPPKVFEAKATMRGLQQMQPLAGAGGPIVDENADELVALWRLRFPEPETLPFIVHPAARQTTSPASRPKRTIAVLKSADVTHVAFLPRIWTVYDAPVEIQLLYDESISNNRSLRMSLVDAERSALLGYLGSSQMGEATTAFGADGLGEEILREMKYKRRNPLAAAAAAYVGLGFRVGDERRDSWSPWLRNLMNWFPAVPDGAILYARDRIDRAESNKDLRVALRALMRAYHRGPPYFSVGVRQLLACLDYFASDPESSGVKAGTFEAMRRHTASFALLTDPSQAFTVLTLRKDFLDV